MINSKTGTLHNAHTQYEKSNEIQRLLIADDNYIVCENEDGKFLTVKDYKDFFKGIDNIYYMNTVIKTKIFTEETVPRYIRNGKYEPIVKPKIITEIDKKTKTKVEKVIYEVPIFDNRGNIKDSRTLQSQSKGGKSRQVPSNYVICSRKRSPKIYAFNQTFIGMLESPKFIETTFLPGFESSSYDYSRRYSTKEIKELIPKYCKFKKSIRNNIKQEYLDDIVDKIRTRKELNLKVIRLQKDLLKFDEGSTKHINCQKQIDKLNGEMYGMTKALADKYFEGRK